MSGPADGRFAPWGEWTEDGSGNAVFRYAGPPDPSRRMVMQLSNGTVRLLVRGTGSWLPLVRTDCLFSLSGPPGAPALCPPTALLLEEGGVATPVVGCDSPEAGQPTAHPAELRLSGRELATAVALPDLTVVRSLLLPADGAQAVVWLFEVSNRGSGSRWLSMHEVVPFSPVVVGREVRRRSGSLFKALIGQPTVQVLDNGYLSVRTAAGQQRCELELDWVTDRAADLAVDGHLPLLPPPMQLVALTRNVSFHVRELPQQVLTALAEWSPGPRPESFLPLTLEARFRVAANERQVAAALLWFGPWEEARDGLKRILPLALFRQNEELMSQRLGRMVRLAPRRSDLPATSESEHSWNLGLATGAAWKGLTSGTITVPPGGRRTFSAGEDDDSRLRYALLLGLTLADPLRAKAVLAGAVANCASLLAAWRPSPEPPGRPLVSEALWTAQALSDYLAANGSPWDEELTRSGRQLLDELVQLFERKDLTGPQGLLTTQWTDEDESLEALAPLRKVRSARVESVAATAQAVATTAFAAQLWGGAAEKLADQLSTLSDRSREALLRAMPDGECPPRWLVDGRPVGGERCHIENLLHLLRALPDSHYADRWLDQLVSRNWSETGLRLVDAPVGAGRPAGLVSPERIVDPLWNLLAVQILGQRRPEQAMQVCFGSTLEHRAESVGTSWNRLFTPATWEPLEVDGCELSDADLFSPRGAVARLGLTTALLGLTPSPAGLFFNTALLARYSLEGRLLSVRGGSRLMGRWSGTGKSVMLAARFSSAEEAARWRPAGQPGRPYCHAGQTLKWQAEANEEWVLEKE